MKKILALSLLFATLAASAQTTNISLLHGDGTMTTYSASRVGRFITIQQNDVIQAVGPTPVQIAVPVSDLPVREPLHINCSGGCDFSSLFVPQSQPLSEAQRTALAPPTTQQIKDAEAVRAWQDEHWCQRRVEQAEAWARAQREPVPPHEACKVSQ